jgi:DnaD/phage-associated family protein
MQLQLKNDSKSTAVPNRFIECCLKAPEKYTESYLLTLMYASNNKEINFEILFARLRMSQPEFIEVFTYWQEKGLAIIENKNNGIGLTLGGVYCEPDEDLYTEREFNQKLQTIFGSRQLSPHEYLKIYDYTDMFGLPKPVVLLLAEYCVLLKGRRVSVAYMDKVAKSWAEEEAIDTEEKAKEKIAAYKTAASGIARVLKQLGITRREPTQDEADLYQKWTGEWGFTLEAIITACSHTTAAREPSMKYLDRILERLFAQGSTTSRKIAEDKTLSERSIKNIQELMRIVGEANLKPSVEYESLYHKWTNVYGFDMDMLSLAARHSGSRGKKPLPYIDAVLTDWYNKRISTAEGAKRYITERQAFDERIKAVFKAAGISRSVTDIHRKAYTKWNEKWEINSDAILLAAEISSLSENSYRYLNTILTNWHNAGVKTLKDAQRETKKYSGKSNVSERASYERPIGKYDHLAVDLFNDEGA